MKEVIVRTAREKDLIICEQLLNSQEFKMADGQYFTAKMEEEYLDDNFFLVAELDGKVTGCAIGEKLKMRGCVLCFLVIDKNHRDKGIGSKLIEEMEKRAHKIGCEWILVYSDLHNPKTLEFYKKHNYVIGSNYVECKKDI